MSTDADPLFREYRQRLLAVARRGLRDPEASADAVQDTFTRYLAHQKQPTAEPVVNPPALLRRILMNLLLDRHRVSGRFLPAPPDSLAELPDLTPDAEDRLITEEGHRRLRRLILELPPRGRQVIFLHKFRGLSYAEIGRTLGISENTVVVHMGRALAQLRRRLKEDAGDAA